MESLTFHFFALYLCVLCDLCGRNAASRLDIVGKAMVLLPLDPHGLAPFTEGFQGNPRKVLVQLVAGVAPDRLGHAAAVKGTLFLLPLPFSFCPPSPEMGPSLRTPRRGWIRRPLRQLRRLRLH